MAQATFSIRMDTALKQQFDRLCFDFGMNATTAINIFARAVVREKRIPFEISSKSSPKYTKKDFMNAFMALRQDAEKAGIQDMTLDEINQIIVEVRRERNEKRN